MGFKQSGSSDFCLGNYYSLWEKEMIIRKEKGLTVWKINPFRTKTNYMR